MVDPAPASVANAPSQAQCAYQHALVIDDDPLFQIVITEALKSCGLARTDTANDGLNGLNVLADAGGAIDLVVVDLQMPNMTGVDVIRELGSIGYHGGVIIISSESSNLRQSVENMAKLIGIDIMGSLQKPLNVEALTALIQTHTTNEREGTTRLLPRAKVMKAISQNDLIPYFQPKIDLASNSVTGFEILSRHIGKLDGTAPTHYLEAVEKYGLSIEFLYAMISQTGELMAEWQPSDRALDLSFNLTPLAVQNSGLPDRLLACVCDAGLDPKQITFEITENHLLDCTAKSLEVLSLMRLYGFGLSIDDFGTGATSIEQLRKFPFTELKIDGHFLMTSESDAFSRLTVETSARLAEMLDMKVVAEGVETEAALEFAKQSGAHEVQGFYFARPMIASEALNWLRTDHQPDRSGPA